MSKPDPSYYGLPFVSDEFNGMPNLYLGNSGLRVSKMGLGTWKIGLPETGDGSRVGKKEAFNIFDRAVEEGVTFWDTANRYNASSGNSERVIGEWLKANPDMRRNIVLATKVFGLMDGKTPNHCRLSRLNIKESLYACLERLDIDRVDLLYFHTYDGITPSEESLSAISDLVSQDLIRYLAVSNFSKENMETYSNLSKKGFPVTVAVQNRFNILQGPNEKEKDVLDFCHKNKVSFIPWGPLGQGLLTDRYLDKAKIGKGDRLFDENAMNTMLTDVNMRKLRKLDTLSKKWDMTISEITLAYTLTLPGMGPMIPSATSIAHVKSNAKAGKVVLSAEQSQEISMAIQ